MSAPSVSDRADRLGWWIARHVRGLVYGIVLLQMVALVYLGLQDQWAALAFIPSIAVLSAVGDYLDHAEPSHDDTEVSHG